MTIAPGERRILALLRLASIDTFASSKFDETLQSVKSALYEKDYVRAFGTAAHQSVYVARWVPSRALLYRSMFLLHILPLLPAPLPSELRVVALGAGSTAELIALASLNATGDLSLHSISLIDAADWSGCVSHIEDWVKKPEKDCGLACSTQISFQQLDCLALDLLQAFLQSLPPSPKWFTIFFTLHELFLQSRPDTLGMLAALAHAAVPGDLLVIIESASLATININGTEYQLGMLLKLVLKEWKLLLSHDSLWYRMPPESKALYPIPLENSRLFVRVYQKK